MILIPNNNTNVNFDCQWSELVETIIKDPKIFNNDDKTFVNELLLAELLNKKDFRKVCKYYFLSNKQISKNETNFEFYKEEGNKLIQSNDFDKILQAAYNYTIALFISKKDTLAAISHANRAAALLKLEYFLEAYDDCEASIECNYPQNKIQKIYVRQAFCAAKLMDKNKLKKAISNLHQLKQTTQIINEISKYNEELQRIELLLPCGNNVTNESTVSKKQKFLQDSSKGRYIVAGEFIAKFETINIEKAFAFVPVQISSEYISCHCETCGRLNVIPFPCYNCWLVSFCSLKCKKKGTHHNIECQGIKTNIFMQIGIGHLALRTFLTGESVLKCHIIKKYKSQKLLKDEVWKVINDFKECDSSVYASVLRLNTNFEKINFFDMKRYAATGAMVMEYLKTFSNYFETESMNDLYEIVDRSDWELIVSALIICHLAQMVSNAHTVSDFEIINFENVHIWKNKQILKPGYLSYIASSSPFFAAIYPQISLYNHSCQSNFYNKFNNIDLHVIATENIGNNDEIFNCYGKSCNLIDRNTRLAELKAQYHFNCTCKHCSNHDDIMFGNFHMLKCLQNTCKYKFVIQLDWWLEDEIESKKLLKCSNCKTTFNLDWLMEWKQIIEEIDLDRKFLNLRNLKRILEIFKVADDCLVGHHVYKQILITKFLSVINLFLLLNNDIDISKEIAQKFVLLAIQNLDSCENIFNYPSLEYVTAASIFLDIVTNLKLKKIEIKIDYNLEKILTSFQILSKNTKEIFVNYILTFLKEYF